MLYNEETLAGMQKLVSAFYLPELGAFSSISNPPDEFCDLFQSTKPEVKDLFENQVSRGMQCDAMASASPSAWSSRYVSTRCKRCWNVGCCVRQRAKAPDIRRVCHFFKRDDGA